MKIPVKHIIEIGLLRLRKKCGLCGKKMDVENHNIQLCRRCRMYELDKFANEVTP